MRQAYICGKYTNEDPAQVLANVEAAIQVAADAAKKGWTPICPHTMGPHRGITWDGAMDRCRELVQGLDPATDCLVLIPGWEKSRGAREEFGLATAGSVPVYSIADLPMVLP